MFQNNCIRHLILQLNTISLCSPKDFSNSRKCFFIFSSVLLLNVYSYVYVIPLWRYVLWNSAYTNSYNGAYTIGLACHTNANSLIQNPFKKKRQKGWKHENEKEKENQTKPQPVTYPYALLCCVSSIRFWFFNKFNNVTDILLYERVFNRYSIIVSDTYVLSFRQ
jgi:hypothetical protein